MPGPQASATTVVVARLHPGTRPDAWRLLDARAGGAAAPITWAADADTLAALAPEAPSAPWALVLDARAATTRRDLRTVLGRVTRLPVAIGAAVGGAGVTLIHRDLLVDAGIRIAAVDRFDEAGRSRRPAPDGWACRSVVWGLWEAEATAPLGPGFARWLPWGGRPAPGSLTLTTVDLDPDARIAGAALGKAVGRWQDCRGVRMARLNDLPALLGGEGPSRSGSVLRAA